MLSLNNHPLPHPDCHHWQAAEGWLELGNPVEAAAELEKIAPHLRDYHDVLQLRYELHARAKRWESALEIVSSLAQQFPTNPNNWIHRSFALHELKRTLEARDLLLPAASKFKQDGLIRYNLACYECQLGNLPAAKQWLAEAFALNPNKELKFVALEDPDLEPLRGHIGELLKK
ncbi:MAG: tetratricopeptide repeat protein [Verrucomicrobiota bacterium]